MSWWLGVEWCGRSSAVDRVRSGFLSPQRSNRQLPHCFMFTSLTSKTCNSKKQLGTILIQSGFSRACVAFDEVTSGARLDSSCERVQLILIRLRDTRLSSSGSSDNNTLATTAKRKLATRENEDESSAVCQQQDHKSSKVTNRQHARLAQ